MFTGTQDGLLALLLAPWLLTWGKPRKLQEVPSFWGQRRPRACVPVPVPEHVSSEAGAAESPR